MVKNQIVDFFLGKEFKDGGFHAVLAKTIRLGLLLRRCLQIV
jgi:hypothetical protein